MHTTKLTETVALIGVCSPSRFDRECNSTPGGEACRACRRDLPRSSAAKSNISRLYGVPNWQARLLAARTSSTPPTHRPHLRRQRQSISFTRARNVHGTHLVPRSRHFALSTIGRSGGRGSTIWSVDTGCGSKRVAQIPSRLRDGGAASCSSFECGGHLRILYVAVLATYVS